MLDSDDEDSDGGVEPMPGNTSLHAAKNANVVSPETAPCKFGLFDEDEEMDDMGSDQTGQLELAVCVLTCWFHCFCAVLSSADTATVFVPATDVRSCFWCVCFAWILYIQSIGHDL